MIDGVLDEDVWSSIEVYADQFQQYFPTDSVKAEQQTIIKMAFDDNNLYIGIECLSDGNDYVIPALKRDFRAGGNDNITLLIDPFSDGANAFMFGTNPAGVQREGLISQGGTTLDGFTTSWDNKWKCETKILEDRYVVEMAIPFSTLRFNKDVRQWKFNSYRFDMISNERSTWAPIPRNQWIFNLGYMGNMNFQEDITAEGSKVSLIPYTIASYEKDAENGLPSNFKYNFGGDAKFAITSGLNLDVTANPDFSQVEVDRQVTNLSRFEISFPERRQFFLENADLFGSFGFRSINPFFSRRIGIVQDTATDTNIQNTIYGGARLSGKLNNNWRVGLLSMVTQADDNAAQPDVNYSVATVQRKIGDRSNIGAIFVNRQSLKSQPTDAIDRFNRVVGLDYNLATSSNLWAGKTFVHRSFDIDQSKDAFAHGLELNYNKRRFLASWQHEYVGDGYNAQMGFVRRTDYFKIMPDFRVFFYPTGAITGLEFANNSRLNVELQRKYIYLFGDFDPTGTSSEPLLEGTDYTYYAFVASYSGQVALSYNYNQFDMPHLDENKSTFLLGPRFDFSFSKELFLTAFFQYNSQSENTNINTRLQWRFAPASDFFLVYADNYFSGNPDDPADRFAFDLRNRSIVAKVTYWLNM